MNIKALAEKHNDYIIERRRYYHAHPELSTQEKETRESIRKDLEAMGITDIRMFESCYGLTADIHGAKPGPMVALRADIDALPVKEATGLSFASENEGKMHACGHDNHIAMLLGAAKILNEVKDELCGTVRLIVQPAEESGLGARQMLQEGAMEGVSAVYGVHIWGTLDAPLIDFSAGRRLACCHTFVIHVKGMSAHGAAPHLGIDAITVSAAIINNLQQCVSRMNDPVNPLVLTIGTIKGGSRFNVICNEVTMEGTVRTFSMGKEVEETMRRIITSTAEGFGAEASLEYAYMTLPVINKSEPLMKLAKDAVCKLYGPEYLGTHEALMVGEDFSWLGESGAPYVFGLVGSRNQEIGCIYTNHHEKYDVEETVLHRGAAVAAQFAADFLAQ